LVVETLTIGELARGAGVNVETVRYYERRGLLDEPPRSPSGYRQYSADDLWRLQFIGRAKRLGFTLGEIGDLLGSGRCADAVLAAAHAKLATVIERQRELVELQGRLRELVELCEGGDPGACAALDVLS
jgi:MerR family mercuric resistance operon transcriptional regulator